MATPTQNFVGTTSVSTSYRYLIDGVKWGGGLGKGVLLTYSFPSGVATFATPYPEFSFGWYSTTSAEQFAIRSGLSAWAQVSGVGFRQVADNSSTVGELRFALTDYSPSGAPAFAYTPSNNPKAGDVWFKEGAWNPGRGSVVPGTYDYLTILHEIGHALGLKHSFEFPNPVPNRFDNYFSTIMSYTASPWTDDNYASFYPTTPMYFDLVAIQALYGRNPNHNAGNNTYTFYDTGTYFQTIDDAGGRDTINYLGSDPGRIDLRIGHWSDVGQAISFSDGFSSSSSVWIGPRTIIERASGGIGSDVLIGNGVNNILAGQNGNDSLLGLNGSDRLFGGPDNDKLIGGNGRDIMVGGPGGDRFDFNKTSESVARITKADLIRDFMKGEDRIDLSTIDASTRIPGNDTFKWLGRAGISTKSIGEVRYSFIDKPGTGGDRTVVHVDTDNDRAPEMQILLVGLHNLSADDFIL